MQKIINESYIQLNSNPVKYCNTKFPLILLKYSSLYILPYAYLVFTHLKSLLCWLYCKNTQVNSHTKINTCRNFWSGLAMYGVGVWLKLKVFLWWRWCGGSDGRGEVISVKHTQTTHQTTMFEKTRFYFDKHSDSFFKQGDSKNILFTS